MWSDSVPDGFVARISSNGSRELFGTFLGGVGDDQGLGVAVVFRPGLFAPLDIFVTGRTSSTDFPVTGMSPFNGGFDGFLTRITLTPFITRRPH